MLHIWVVCTTSSPSCYTSGSFALHPVSHVTHPGRLHYIQSVMLHIRVVCTTSSPSCYTSGSFALHPVRHVTHPGRLHYIQSVMLHIRVVCLQHMASWKRRDMQKVCGDIFKDRKWRNIQPNLNVHQRFCQILRLYNNIYTGIYAESFNSIRMLAYRASFCYAVDLKFVQMLS